MIRIPIPALFTVVLLLLHAIPAGAGIDDGVAAYERGDYAAAIAAFLPHAEQGDAYAQHRLARMYDFGEGVARNEAMALKWYREAAGQGHAEAQYNLGVMFAMGRGVPRDRAKWVTWISRAADLGYAPAQFDLGAAYANGLGVARDDVRAHMWLDLAAAGGYGKARLHRKTVAGRMSAAEIAGPRPRSSVARTPRAVSRLAVTGGRSSR